MNILTFTTLFPNSQMPRHGIFVKHRTAALAKREPLVVVAPVPWCPQFLGGLSKKYRLYTKVPREEDIDGIKVYHPRYFITPKILRSLYGIFMFLSLFLFVRKLHKEYKFNIIDANFVYPDGTAAVLIAKFLKIPVVVTARGSDVNFYTKFKFLKKCIQYTLKQASQVVSVSQDLKNVMVHLGIREDKIKVIANGIHHEHFCPGSKTKAREELKLPQNKTILLSVGLLLERKGYHFLIQALSLIKDRDAVLYIIGEGPWRKKLQRMVRTYKLDNKVFLLGERPHQQLKKWYRAADFFCLTSLHEGRPNVVVEAISCGTPVVTMNRWGLSEFVDERRGILLDSYNVKDISNSIEQAISKKWDPKYISLGTDHLSWDKTVEDLSSVFSEHALEEDILFFSSDDWNSGLKTSKYHLSTRLARKHRVFYVNSLSLRSPTMSKRDIKKIFSKLWRYLRGVRKVRENLYVITPLIIPFQRFQWVRALNQNILILQFKFLLRKYKCIKPIIWTFLPNTLDIVKRLPKEKLIYYCVDDMSAFNGVPKGIIRQQDELLTKEADLVFTVSQELFTSKKGLNDQVHYSPHGVDFELFSKAVTEKHIAKPDDLRSINDPIIGFYGLISKDWIDFKLVQYLANQHPSWSFVFIGKLDHPLSEIPLIRNIHYLPVKLYEELYTYSHFFDVAFLPFNVNQLTIHSHPLKILEYLSSGKPVVSVDIPEVHQYKDIIEIASGYEDFSSKLKKCLNEKNSAFLERRVQFASRNSWEKRYETIRQIITHSS